MRPTGRLFVSAALAGVVGAGTAAGHLWLAERATAVEWTAHGEDVFVFITTFVTHHLVDVAGPVT